MEKAGFWQYAPPPPPPLRATRSLGCGLPRSPCARRATADSSVESPPLVVLGAAGRTSGRGSAAYSASATVVAMAKGNGKGRGVRGGAPAGTNKVSPIPFHLNLN
ncbi:hypothetical protein PVAP13_9NG012602 [Panicum virgatum]|uniref:Uncharacterized protein n=1 Tax=Panicum virgatum TaxID=38727 RepID=A0A8T0MBS1_PANVG|nr:hypothetical protein PVAP13_9NG012602 [Panicum virgatum]